SPHFAPQGVYRCAGDDRWVAISAPTEEAWLALARVAGCGWAADARFATLEARLRHRAALDAAIEAWTSGEDRDALAVRLREAGVPAAPVNTPPDWLTDPSLVEAGYFARVSASDVGEYRTDGLPV